MEIILSSVSTTLSMEMHSFLTPFKKERMLEKFLEKYNLLCLNEKEETYYRAYDGCKSAIGLTLVYLIIGPVYKCSKEYEFRGSDYFPIIIEEEIEVFMKQQQI